MSRWKGWVPVLGALALLGAAPAPGTTVVSSVVHSFSAGSREGMLYPNAVAVDGNGRVWVADGARDRVLVFSGDGGLTQTVRRVAGVGLSRPMGIATTPDGRVWIADAGNNRIAVTSATSATESTISVDKALGKVDLSDVAVSTDGSVVYAVDNDGSRLLRLDVGTSKWEARGSRGNGWANFHNPHMVALDDQGRTYVTDVLNGRVERFDANGKGARPVVKYGVSAGQVFRPSGVDVEGDRLWVADAVLGVIQVFTTEGVLIDAVRDSGGNVLHLDGPLGIDVVGDRLYVVESRAGKVSELLIRGGGGTPLVASEVKATSKSESQGQECTLCHLDFIAPLDEGVSTALVAPPKTVGGASWAGLETTCLSCHDGSVNDSRRHIWSGFAHPRGADAVIPGDMKIPKEIPLVNGQIACKTCHTPHSLGGSAQQHRGATFMRVEARPNELCVACHGPGGGMAGTHSVHPVGAVTEEAAKAIGNPKLEVVECLDCHVPHGAADEGLLSGRDHGERSCLNCHKGFSAETHAGGHPMDQLVPRRAADAVRKLGGELGPNNTLVCGSCHDAHSDSNLRDRCYACHEEQASVAFASAAQKGHRSGVCTDCHNADSASLKLIAGRVTGDPTNCLRCHGEGSPNQPVDVHPGQVGHKLVDQPGGFGPSDPPLNGCISCHGGHDIVRPDSSLCETCHKEQAADHARGGHGTATCLDCHPAHEAKTLHADATDHKLNPIARRCLACHAEDAPGDATVPRVEAFEHPVPMFLPDGPRWQPLGGIPLFDAAGLKVAATENGDLTCASCHLSHGPDINKPGDSLRRPGWNDTCAACHGDDALLYYRWFHYRERLEGVVKPAK